MVSRLYDNSTGYAVIIWSSSVTFDTRSLQQSTCSQEATELTKATARNSNVLTEAAARCSTNATSRHRRSSRGNTGGVISTHSKHYSLDPIDERLEYIRARTRRT